LHSQSQSYDADLELAKKLQAEFDAQESKNSNSNSNSNSNTSSSLSQSTHYSSQSRAQTLSSSAASSKGTQECPICGSRVQIADLEAHVEQHFEDEEAKRGPAKPGEKPMTKAEAKEGFFAKFFGGKDDKKTTST
jgi:hypothetical protein